MNQRTVSDNVTIDALPVELRGKMSTVVGGRAWSVKLGRCTGAAASGDVMAPVAASPPPPVGGGDVGGPAEVATPPDPAAVAAAPLGAALALATPALRRRLVPYGPNPVPLMYPDPPKKYHIH